MTPEESEDRIPWRQELSLLVTALADDYLALDEMSQAEKARYS